MAEVKNNRAESRFELEEQGQLAIAVYERAGDTVTFTHTAVPPALEGHGVGSRLIAGALDQVRAAGERVVPECPFVHAYMRRHPETQDLLAAPFGD